MFSDTNTLDFSVTFELGSLANNCRFATTINEYEKLMTILSEQKSNINKSIKELTDNGWSGESKDKFEEAHIKRQELYAKLEADVEAMRSALETEEKPRAVQLKKRSEDFVNCIKRSGSGSALTSDDEGIISLNGGQFQINNNVDNCTSDYYKRMNSKFDEILNIANNLEYTSFAIGGYYQEKINQKSYVVVE